jgi:outer membrane cobalamin receptor
MTHIFGYKLRIFAATALAALPSFASAQTQPQTSLDTVVVSGRRVSELGTETSASAGTITHDQVQEQPTLRPGEILQLVPGLVVVQHAAGGKANQYYLRGFEMDHGDMFSTWVDGVPVNEPSHAHGPGYTDLNWLIPEFVDHIDFEKGPYYADRGDFASAGAADIHLVDAVPTPFLKEEVGTDGWIRLLGADSAQVGLGTLFLGAEYTHYDGPWVGGDNYRKRNGIVKYTQGDADNGFTVTAQAYRGNWLGNDQVPLEAIQSGQVPLYGSEDPSTGGTSARYSLYGQWHETDDTGRTQATLYAVHYMLNLYANFTDALFFPIEGDGQQQNDRRWTYGGHVERDLTGDYLGQGTEDRLGFELRDDNIHSFLNRVEDNLIWAPVRQDQVDETMISPWYENDIAWTDWFSTFEGVRADILVYSDQSDTVQNSGNGIAWRPSPKIGAKFGPWSATSFYIQAGLGISSEDIEGVTSTVQPGPYANPGVVSPTSAKCPVFVPNYTIGGGCPTTPEQALTRNRGAEIGVHTSWIPGLDTTLSLWTLESENEFVYDGDFGAVTASGRPGRRWGIEWNNRWQPTGWMDVTADLALSRAHYLDQNDPLGNQIPESVRSMTAGQVTLHDLAALPDTTWTLGWRYLGPRFLIADSTAQSTPSLVFNTKAEYAITPKLSIGAEILNLFNAHYYDAEYWYQYRLSGQPFGGKTGYVVHPAEPLQVRFSIMERF